MKIILLVDIPKLGRKNDIKNVSDGYALNFLIPKGLAVIATPQKIKEIDLLKKEDLLRRQEQEKIFQEWIDKLKKCKLEFKINADKSGRLFGSLQKKNIIEKLNDLQIKIDERQIFLEKPIKKVGEYLIKIKFSPQSETELKINVIADQN